MTPPPHSRSSNPSPPSPASARSGAGGSSGGGGSPSLLAAFLERTALGPRQVRKSFALWPLALRPEAGSAAGLAYVALADALAAGTLLVDEVDEHGSVPHVRATNRGAEAVLVLFGEELAGAKQNRVANASFLVPAQREIVLDVSCVEAGRWSRRPGTGFASGDAVVSSLLRRKMAGKVREMRARSQRFVADQAEVWEEIERRFAGSAADSPTRDYRDYARRHAAEVEEIVCGFALVPRQVGFVAELEGRILGAEVVGRPAVFARVFRELLRSYAIDAADSALVRGWQAEEGASERSFEAPEAFLEALAQAPAALGPSLGVGEDARIEGDGVSGCALVAGDVIHLCAFPASRAIP